MVGVVVVMNEEQSICRIKRQEGRISSKLVGVVGSSVGAPLNGPPGLTNNTLGCWTEGIANIHHITVQIAFEERTRAETAQTMANSESYEKS